VAAVVALSVNLRMRERAGRLAAGLPVLVAALTVVVAPWPVPHVLQHLPGLTSSPVMQILGLVLTLVLWLTGALVWLLGHRRTAVALWTVYAAATVLANVRTTVDSGFDEAAWHLGAVVVPTLVTAAAVAVAGWRGVTPPHPRRVWMVLVPATVAVSLANAFSVTDLLGPGYLPPDAAVAAGAAVAVVAAVLVATGRTRPAVLVPAAVVAALSVVGFVPGWLALTVVVSAVGMLARAQDAPSTSLVT
jgi:hypothetical protein